MCIAQYRYHKADGMRTQKMQNAQVSSIVLKAESVRLRKLVPDEPENEFVCKRRHLMFKKLRIFFQPGLRLVEQ